MWLLYYHYCLLFVHTKEWNSYNFMDIETYAIILATLIFFFKVILFQFCGWQSLQLLAL